MTVQVVRLQSSVMTVESRVSELTIQLQKAESDKSSSDTRVSHWKYKCSQLTEKYEQEKTTEHDRHL